MLDEFRRDLVGKNRAKNTLDGIDFTLGKAQDHLKKPLESLSIEDLKRYFEGLKERGLQTNTILSHEHKFIQFYDWCFNETDNEKYSTLSRKIKRIKVDRVKTPINPSEILLSEEIKRLINVANLERDRCIIASLYESGMRIGEFVSLKNDMVQLDELKQEVTFHIPNTEGCRQAQDRLFALRYMGMSRTG